MSRSNRGRILLSMILVVVGIGSIPVDFNSTHIFNPAWPPHARYHDVMLLTLWAGIAAMTLWLLWRPSREPQIGVIVATLVPLISTGSFFVALLVPGASPMLSPDLPVPHVAGIPILPNLAVSVVLFVLTLVAYWLCWRDGIAQAPAAEI